MLGVRNSGLASFYWPYQRHQQLEPFIAARGGMHRCDDARFDALAIREI